MSEALAQNARTFVREELDGISFEVTVPKHELILGEPLVLDIAITNVSGSPLTIDGPLRQQASRHCLLASFVHRETGGSGAFASGIWRHLAYGYPLTLEPGQTVECAHWFASQLATPLDRKKLGIQDDLFVWALPVPGVYEIRVSFLQQGTRVREGAWRGKITTAPVTVVVKVPDDAQTRKALAIWAGAQSDLATRGRIRALSQRMQNVRSETLLACKGVVEKYPDSIYAPWAAYLIALLAQPGGSRLSELERFVSNYPNFVLVDEALYEIAEDAKEDGLDHNSRMALAIQANPRHVARIDKYRDRW